MTKTKQKILGIALTASMIASCFTEMSISASAEPTGSTYTVTIPSTLTVENSGWNSIGNISATGSLESGKKLTVTAASTNNWKLVSGTNNVSYTMKSASADTVATTSWEFTELSSTATTKSIGIDVSDYSTKPAGTYQDTVTFTAKVENAAPTATPLDNTTTAWTAGTYAVPAGGLTYSDAITVSGDVTLTLTDGATLTLNKGISLASGATLTVEGNGTMNVNGTNDSTASTVAGTGMLVLTSGTLNANGGNGQGGGSEEYPVDYRPNAGGNAINGNVTVSGGTLTATGGNGGGLNDWCDGYGGNGGAAISGNVTITDGTVTATGGNGGSMGIATEGSGGNGGAAIGGDATISGGTWTATNGTNGGGQGGGAGGNAVAGTVTDNRS